MQSGMKPHRRISPCSCGNVICRMLWQCQGGPVRDWNWLRPKAGDFTRENVDIMGGYNWFNQQHPFHGIQGVYERVICSLYARYIEVVRWAKLNQQNWGAPPSDVCVCETGVRWAKLNQQNWGARCVWKRGGIPPSYGPFQQEPWWAFRVFLTMP